MADGGARQAAIDHLWRLTPANTRRAPYLHCILDAARDPAIYAGLERFRAREQIVSLYQGPTAEELADVAPYLVCLGSNPALFDWIWEEGWGKSWGIFFWSVLSVEGLRTHFRRLTRVKTDDGATLLFRFYDPRVLSAFLPTCDPAQTRELFGPIGHFYTETNDPPGIAEFSHADGVPRRRFLPFP